MFTSLTSLKTPNVPFSFNWDAAKTALKIGDFRFLFSMELSGNVKRF